MISSPVITGLGLTTKHFALDNSTKNENKNEDRNENKNENKTETNSENTDLASKIFSGVNNALGGGAKGEQKEGQLTYAYLFIFRRPFLTPLLFILPFARHPRQRYLTYYPISFSTFKFERPDTYSTAIDYVQEHVFKQGAQTSESAIEQAKDKRIAAAIRSGYKTVSGKDFPI